MKKMLLIPMLIITAFAVVGCEDDNEVLDPAPQPPQGVFSVTGDGEVTIWWAGPYDRDIAEYWIYRAQAPMNNPPTEYEYLFAYAADDNPNLDLLYYSAVDDQVVNGSTYWYAVASVDHAGQVSDLSAEDIFDTPRPEGVVTLFDLGENEFGSGYDFSGRTQISPYSPACDVFVDADSAGDVFYINSVSWLDPSRNVLIQDMGYTGSWDEIGWAPQAGWSNLGYAELVVGHTYVVRTEDNHFAKLRLENINAAGRYAQFLWAYQTDQGNPELIAPNGDGPVADNTTSAAKQVSSRSK